MNTTNTQDPKTLAMNALVVSAEYMSLHFGENDNIVKQARAAISALQLAAAQPQASEPSAEVCGDSDANYRNIKKLLRVIDAMDAAPARAVEPLTDSDIQAAVTDAYKNNQIIWAGFEKDADGVYNIPALSPSHYKLARTAIAAFCRKNGIGIPATQAAQGGSNE